MLRKCWPALQRGGHSGSTDGASNLVAAFKILGLVYHPSHSRHARPTLEDVRKQYRELARLHHPDLEGGDDTQMKVINTAYELIQSHAAQLRQDSREYSSSRAQPSAYTGSEKETRKEGGGVGERGRRRAGTRHQRVSSDFASGDDTSWAMKSTLDWHTMVHSTTTLTPEELNNPANHPLSHSKFFSFDDDLTIYRSIRGGATVPQVARTLGKPATFIEKRLQNAQFRNRVQYVLRTEKRHDKRAKPTTTRGAANAATNARSQGSGATVSESAAPNITTRILRQSPYDDVHSVPWDRRNLGSVFRGRGNDSSKNDSSGMSGSEYRAEDAWERNGSDGSGANSKDHALPGMSAGSLLRRARQATRKSEQQQQGRRLKEWEATYPRWRQPVPYAHMSLAEKGLHDGLLRRGEVMGETCSASGSGMRYGSPDALPRAWSKVFKMGRGYDNYMRLGPQTTHT